MARMRLAEEGSSGEAQFLREQAERLSRQLATASEAERQVAPRPAYPLSAGSEPLGERAPEAGRRLQFRLNPSAGSVELFHGSFFGRQ
eukprot:528053-Prorocentrum_minimum.AAC.3